MQIEPQHKSRQQSTLGDLIVHVYDICAPGSRSHAGRSRFEPPPVADRHYIRSAPEMMIRQAEIRRAATG